MNCRILGGVSLLMLMPVLAAAKSTVDLVYRGTTGTQIVVPLDAAPLQIRATDYFVGIVERRSGVRIPVVRSNTVGTDKPPQPQIILGPSPATDALGFGYADLKPEEFRLIARDNRIVILAEDIDRAGEDRDSAVTAWAFAYLMDHHLGVRHLWPGELGTVVPKNDSLTIPEFEFRYQIPIKERRFREHPPRTEVATWLHQHQVMGYRVRHKGFHSFRDRGDNGPWWDDFHKTRPELLAKDPSGQAATTRGRADLAKICVSNPGTTDEVVRRWVAAGSPDYWDVTPNDGKGFCSCDDCRALDLRYGGTSYTREEVWNRPGHVSLTDRYVWFWNGLIRQMREINPQVTIGVYFYSAYRVPPKSLTLEPGIFGLMVPSLDFAGWQAWRDVGATQIGLRPNWWYMGGPSPHLPLRTYGAYIEQAREAGMVAVDMDSLMGFWATQGPAYYLTARLIGRPDLATEDIITEYCDAFGAASPGIRAYLDYWESYQQKVAYNIPAGGMVSQGADGIYETVSKDKFGQVLHPLQGHWKTLSALYPPEVMNPARALLTKASEMAEHPLTRQRIAFLARGLDHVEHCMALVDAAATDQPARLRTLAAFREEMETEFGFWGTEETFALPRWGILGKDVDLSNL